MRRMFSLKQLQEIADNRVKTLVEGGTLENAKPIYFHPIRMQITATFGGQVFRANSSLVVLNNSATPFTYATLSKWVYDNNINLIADGPVILGSDNSFAGTLAYWSKNNEESMNMNWIKANGESTTGSVAGVEVVAFDDTGVNKIN